MIHFHLAFYQLTSNLNANKIKKLFGNMFSSWGFTQFPKHPVCLSQRLTVIHTMLATDKLFPQPQSLELTSEKLQIYFFKLLVSRFPSIIFFFCPSTPDRIYREKIKFIKEIKISFLSFFKQEIVSIFLFSYFFPSFHFAAF